METQDILNTILQGDVLEQLKQLPDESVHCIVSSPPYWGLRNYGLAPTHWPACKFNIGFGFEIDMAACTVCLGLELTPEMFIAHLVLIFNECHRVLHHDGTLWLNLGDSYAGSQKGQNGNGAAGKFGKLQQSNKGTTTGGETTGRGSLKPKDLVGIPWMAAFALRASGWYLRQDIIWHKPNPMPESVTDRCTKGHEYIFLFSKSQKYFYDAEAIKVTAKNPEGDARRFAHQKWENKSSPDKIKNGIRPRKSGNIERKSGSERGCPENNGSNVCSHVPWEGLRANKRSVWTVPSHSFAEAHFATFPPDLIVDCIKAGTSEYGCCAECGSPLERKFSKQLKPGPKAAKTFVIDERDVNADDQDQGSNRQKDGHKPGWINETTTTGWRKTCKCATDEVKPAVVLDIFMGAGTTALVARKLNRNFIGIELNPKYIAIAERRLKKELGLFFAPITNGGVTPSRDAPRNDIRE